MLPMIPPDNCDTTVWTFAERVIELWRQRKLDYKKRRCRLSIEHFLRSFHIRFCCGALVVHGNIASLWCYQVPLLVFMLIPKYCQIRIFCRPAIGPPLCRGQFCGQIYGTALKRNTLRFICTERKVGQHCPGEYTLSFCHRTEPLKFW